MPSSRKCYADLKLFAFTNLKVMIKHVTSATLATFCSLVLAACEASNRSGVDDPSASTETATSEPQEEAGNPAAGQTDASLPRITSGAAAPDTIPLTPGVYVIEGTSCENPANAAWRVWDGKGLSGSSTRACRAEVLSHSGDTYRLRNSCENTYDGSRTDETLAITVTDQVHFTTEGVAFASCSTAQVPAALRRRLTGESGSSASAGQRSLRVTADTPINSENYAQVMEARSREYDRLEYKPVALNSFECGDNCYLELTEGIEGAAPRKVLCTARQCADWHAAGRLPARLRNSGARVKFGRANQVDGSGTVMVRGVEAVIDLRL